MVEKAKCGQCNERDVFAKGLCSGCYAKNWRLARKAEREGALPEPRQLTSGPTESETQLAVIEGEIVHGGPPDPHLIALNPQQMEAARDDMKAWLEQKLTAIERDIVEANAALNEARKNGWSTQALTSARNRAIDDETFYNKILAAVEAGHTIIPEFPIEVFAIRRYAQERPYSITYQGNVHPSNTGSAQPLESDCAPVGAGEYRNPVPYTSGSTFENKAPGAQERGEPRWYTRVYRDSAPVGPIVFPSMTARSPIMRATSEAMKEKVFDQIGVCHPLIADVSTASRRVEATRGRLGDPLVIGQILRKRVGSKQKCVSFIIAWHLNLEEL